VNVNLVSHCRHFNASESGIQVGATRPKSRIDSSGLELLGGGGTARWGRSASLILARTGVATGDGTVGIGDGGATA
jgi:hypothetical protein